MTDTPVEIPLRRKYTARKTVKHLLPSKGGHGASKARNRTAHLPHIKGTPQPAPAITMVLDVRGRRRWVRG